MSTKTSKSTKSSSTAKTAKAPASTTSKSEKASEAASKAPTSAIDGSAPATAKKVEPTVVDAPQAVIVGPMMRKKELVDIVVMRSGMKKKDVKPVVEMALTVLGDALRDNRELNLPPLGRLKVRREKQLANGRMVIAKIRQPLPPEGGEAVELGVPAEDY